jgi:DHA3 family macrolide efflux protein-like MFS transporter
MVIWISQAFSLFGSAVVEFALAWYLTIKTGSATILATSMLVAILPQIVLGPFIGPYIDRWDRKRIMILADAAISLMTLGLAVLFWLNAIQIWHVYVAMVGRAIGQAFHFPASSAAVTMIVPEKELSRAAGLNQMMQGIITIAGPPAGAFLFAILPVQGLLAVDIVTAIIAISCLLPVHIPSPLRAIKIAKTSVITEMVESFRYVWNWKGLTALIGVSAVISFFITPVFTLLPIMVNKALEGDVLKLGWLQAAFGVGIIVGGLILGVWKGFKKRVVTSLIGIIICSLATFVLGFVSFGLYTVGLGACFFIGFGLSFANGPIMAVLQAVVARDMQGRVFSLLGSITSAIIPLGLAIAGPTTDAIGIGPIYYIAGIAIFIVSIVCFFLPAVMNLETNSKNTVAVPVPEVEP